jgi:hypothetical protein
METLSGTDVFHHAFFDERTNEVTFEPFQELDWQARARTVLTWLNPDRPTPGQIARLLANQGADQPCCLVYFRAPLDPAVSGATYVLIHATGITPLQPVQLKGSVGFDFGTSMTLVGSPFFSGTIVAKPLHSVAGAAFAIAGKPADVGDADPHVKFERRKQAGSAVYDFTDARGTTTWRTSSKDCSDTAHGSSYECLDAESALSFRLASRRLLLVKWKGAFCSSAYTLFSVDTGIQPIAGNDYDCDL